MTEIPIVVSDDVVTVGGYTNQVELQLSVGATGERGSRIFTGSVDPTTLPTDSPIWGGYTDFKSGDIYLQRDTDLLAVWEWLYVSGEYTWVRTVDNIAGGAGSVTLDPDLDAIAALTGTGLLKRTGPNTWVLDTTTYLTSNQTITLSGDVSGSGTTSIVTTVADDSHSHTSATISALDAGDVTTGTFGIARIPTGTTGTTVALGNHTHSYQPVDGDLTAIAAISGTGYLRRTGVDTWTLDTPATATWGGITGTLSSQTDLQTALNAKQDSDADLTAIAALAGTSGLLKKTAANTWTLDTATYLTSNQTITLSGDASGSGTTAITVTVADDSHSHTGSTISGLDAGDTTTGTFDIARIPTGTTGTTVALGNHTHSYQPLDADLTAIAGLVGTTGFLKKTATDTWALDTTAYTTNTGTVTSVGMTVPTGLSISGSPITTSGTLALTLTAGYSIPTTASQTNWDTAYTDRNKWDGGATGLVAATGRTSLGGTTVGQNLFTLTNPTAVTFLRVNADNTVSTLDAATFRSAIGAGTSSTTGTVTSVGMTVPTGLSISGSPVTTSGTLALTLTAGYEIPTTAALVAKAPLASPTFTGTVTANTIVPSSGYLALNYGTGAFDAVRSGQLQVLRDGVGDWNTLFAAYGTAAEVAADTPRFAVWGIGAFEATYEGKIKGSENVYLRLNGGAGYERQIHFQSNGSKRWSFGAAPNTETGSNAGSTFAIARYSDLDAWIDNPLEIDRATGTVYANDGMAAAAPGTFNSFVAGSTSNVGAGILDGSFVANRDSHAIMYLLAQGSSGIAARIRGWVAGGTAASKTVPTASSLLLSIDARGWGGTGYQGGSGIEFSLGTGTFSDTSMPGKIEFQTVPDGSVTRQTRLTIDQNGLATFAKDVLVSGTSKLYLGNATGGFKGEIRSQSTYPIVLMPYNDSGTALSSAEFYYSTGGNTWNSEVGLNVGGALTVFNSSGGNSISLSSTDGDSLVNIQAGGASGNYGYLRLRSRWGQASQNEVHEGIGSDGSWFVSQKTINGSAVTRDNILHISSAGNVTFNPPSGTKVTIGAAGSTGGLEFGSSGPRIMTASSNPEGSITAPIGSEVINTTDGTKYDKISDTAGSTGWAVRVSGAGYVEDTQVMMMMGVL